MRPEKSVAYYLPELRKAGGDPETYTEPGGRIVPIHQRVLRDVADLLEEQQSKLPSWRNAETDPPTTRGRVFGYWPGLVTSLGGPVDTVFYAPNATQPWGGHDGYPPTLWMPLPEPPK